MFKHIVPLLFLGVASLSADTINGKSAEEIAKELANTNTPLTSVKFELQYTAYEGSLLNADSQDKFLINLQPTLPFPIDKENLKIDKIIQKIKT